MIPIKFAELHAPLFLNGKNFGLKLFSKAGLSLEYDRKEGELWVSYNNVSAFLPSTSVHSMQPETEVTKYKEEPVLVIAPKGKVKAQASTPMGHVFEGPGAGKSR